MDALSGAGPASAETGATETAAVSPVAFLGACFFADTFTPAVQLVQMGKVLQIWLRCLR